MQQVDTFLLRAYSRINLRVNLLPLPLIFAIVGARPLALGRYPLLLAHYPPFLGATRQRHPRNRPHVSQLRSPH